MTCTLIDDFLPEEDFERIHSEIVDQASFPWFFAANATFGVGGDPRRRAVVKAERELETDDAPLLEAWFLAHSLFERKEDEVVYSPFAGPILEPLIRGLQIRKNKLIRAKVNFFPRTPKVRQNAWHRDYVSADYRTALFSLNTCDGFTEFKDGERHASVRNRILIWDNLGPKHRSSTCTDQQRRLNININWIES